MSDANSESRKTAKENVAEIVENTGQLGGHLLDAGTEAMQKGKEIVESVGGGFVGSVQERLKDRENVVMVRVDGASLKKIDDLVEAGIVNSRSEASAYLIAAGIQARQPLFERIALKVEEIRQAKSELHAMLSGEDVEGLPDARNAGGNGADINDRALADAE